MNAAPRSQLVDEPDPGDATVVCDPSTLTRLGEAVLVSLGTPADVAAVVATSLVEANLAGHDSHGMMRLTSYAEWARSGLIVPLARCAVAARSAATATVDGRSGWGQPAARMAAEIGVDIAREHGVAAVTIANCNHIGRLGEYVEIVARNDMMGLAVCNAGPLVAAHGGGTAVLGTNPLAWSVPRAHGGCITADFSTAVVAGGRVHLAAAQGHQLPDDMLVDPNGNPTRDPAQLGVGGALLPFGGHKGYALSVLIELAGGVLSRMGASSLPGYGSGNGTLMLAVDLRRFRPVEEFVAQAEQLSAVLSASATRPGARVVVPGEPEAAERRRRLQTGIPLAATSWTDIVALCDSLDIKVADYAPR